MMASEQMPRKDWYSILGADPSENVSDLRQKYQKLVLKLSTEHLIHVGSEVLWKARNNYFVKGIQSTYRAYGYHPDKQNRDVPAGTVEECLQKFIEVDQAWKVLGNEETKTEYDLQRREDDLRNMGPVDAQVYLEEMSWNEDDHSFSLSCRCGGRYYVSKDEAEQVNLISCDTCSLIVELLHHS